MKKLFYLPKDFLNSPPVQLDQMPIDEEFEDGTNEDIDAGRWIELEEEKLLQNLEND